MLKHLSLLQVFASLCLQGWTITNMFAMSSQSASALKQMRVTEKSDLESLIKRDLKDLPKAQDSVKVDQDKEDLPAKIIGNHEVDTTLHVKDEAEKCSYLTNRRENLEKKRFIQDDKRRLRFIKRSQVENKIKEKFYRDDVKSYTHNLQKRRINGRNQPTLSISNSLSVLTDLLYQYRIEQERRKMNEIRRRMLAVGKRSD